MTVVEFDRWSQLGAAAALLQVVTDKGGEVLIPARK